MLFRILAKVLLKLQATKSEQDKKIKKDDSMDRKKSGDVKHLHRQASRRDAWSESKVNVLMTSEAE